MQSNTSNFPQFFTVEEVAEIFRFTTVAIRRLIHRQEIPAIKIGKEYRISKQAIDTLTRTLTEKTAKAAAFGMWNKKTNPSGEQWVWKHRKSDVRSLAELLKDLEAQ